MRIYVDSSALLKRVFDESESTALTDSLAGHVAAGDSLVSSSLAWVEVSRAVRAYAAGRTANAGNEVDPTDVNVNVDVDDVVGAALSGVLEQPIGPAVVALARRLGPQVLRSLDAIHLTSALLLDADLLVAYDARLVDAASRNGLRTASPGTA